ncbi:MAG: nucleotidyl transferase AbiEii/AbiGii toxin family protein [Chthoniobacterales bacterium]
MNDWMPSLERWIKSRGELQAAVEFTAAKTGFQPALVEKDFWCSVVLGRLYAAGDCPLVFKGGTLLSKAYVAFNRMSEDLDFTLPTGPEMNRSARSKRAREIEEAVGIAGVGDVWTYCHLSICQPAKTLLRCQARWWEAGRRATRSRQWCSLPRGVFSQRASGRVGG